MSLQVPDQPLEWLDHAAALVGLWVAAAALNTMWEAAAPKSLDRGTHALFGLNILILVAPSALVYEATQSFGLTAFALGLVWRWYAGIISWACENLEE